MTFRQFQCNLHSRFDCPICYTRPNIPEPPRPPAQSDALDLLREAREHLRSVVNKDIRPPTVQDTSNLCTAIDAFLAKAT